MGVVTEVFFLLVAAALEPQIWIDIDTAEDEKNIVANMYKPSKKKKINGIDDHGHWPE